MMNCSVVGLSGESLDFDVPKESKVGDLKRLVEDRWAVPRICQKLLCAGHIMSDAFRCEALPEKELQLVVSTETLHIALQSALAAEALDQLQKCARECRGDDAVWSAVEAEVWDCLQTSPVVDAAGVANSAAAVLVAAALARRPKTLEEAFARLEGSCERGRLASVKMLTAMGDPKHMMYLRSRLEDLCPSVRAEAVKGIASLAPLDQGLLFAISGHLHDSNVLVRQAAVEAIGQFVSACGCSQCPKDGECENFPEHLEFACMAILARLQHPQMSVRSFVAAAVARAVAGAAGELCQRCGARRCNTQETWAPHAAQLLGACFVDAAAPVQGVALQAIAELPGEKLTSPELLALKAQVFACLSHADAGVRITASRAITKLVPFGDHEVAAALRSLAKRDSDISVRTAAKNALPFMGEDPF